MKTSITAKQSLIAVAMVLLITSRQKTNLDESMNAATSLGDELGAAWNNMGLYASAADTAAAVKNLYFYRMADFQNTISQEFASNAKDGNGVLYNKRTDEIYQLGRRDKILYVFGNASSLTDPPVATRTITDATLSSGREIAYDQKRDIMYVANNTDSTIRVYRKFSSLSGNVIGETLKISGQPWGITYNANLDKLIVVIDLAAMRLDIFDMPARLKPGAVTASRSLYITDRPNGTFSRLHGVTYNEQMDALIVTEIGEAAAPLTPTSGKPPFTEDGGIYIINNANDKLCNGGNITADNFIYGAKTGLGNPVDVGSRQIKGKPYIFVAEKANKKIVVFRLSDSGNKAPVKTITTTYSPEAITVD